MAKKQEKLTSYERFTGRPSSYQDDMPEKVLRYAETAKYPSIEGLAWELMVNKTTIYKWEKEGKSEEFSNALAILRDKQAQMLWEKGLDGSYNSTIAKLGLNNHGYSDKSEFDHTSKGESIAPKIVSDITPHVRAKAEATEDNPGDK